MCCTLLFALLWRFLGLQKKKNLLKIPHRWPKSTEYQQFHPSINTNIVAPKSFGVTMVGCGGLAVGVGREKQLSRVT
jgi:hypothetical protein